MVPQPSLFFQAPKLDFRHSDNINIFFNFVQKEGLPEGFIFELTDLYNKKNLPKVIYCIHALRYGQPILLDVFQCSFYS